MNGWRDERKETELQVERGKAGIMTGRSGRRDRVVKAQI